MTLRRLGHAPGSKAEAEWHNTLAKAFAAVRGTVCETCGLDAVGHGPQSQWLGHAAHPYTPVAATLAMMQRADSLSAKAYRLHNNPNGPCGHPWPSAACNRGECIHLTGHCPKCQ